MSLIRPRAQVRDLTSNTGTSLEVSFPTIAALRLYQGPATSGELVARTTFGDGGGGSFAVNPGSMADDDGALVIVDALGRRWWRSYARDAIHAVWWGVTTAGASAPDDAALQACIDTFAPFAPLTTQGVKIILPFGRLRFDASVDMEAAHGVHIEGAGVQATECFATGDFPVFKSINSQPSPLNKASIKNMTIRGGGKSNPNAHGISIAWSNRIELENLFFLSCRRCVDIAHAWQHKWDFLQIEGAGADQSYDGFYLDQSDTTYIENCVKATLCTAQGVEHDGFRIINGAGSEFVACEAVGCGDRGWRVANPPVGTVTSQWLHFDNCLGDTCAGVNWDFEKGPATACGEFTMNSVWTGNSGAEGMILTGLLDVLITGVIAFGLPKEAIKLVDCARTVVTGVVARQYNAANGGYACVHLENSTDCKVEVSVATSTNGGDSILESGTSDRNDLEAQGAITAVGAATSTESTQGVYSAQWRRGGNAAIALIAGGEAYFGLGSTADPLLNVIRRIAGGQIEIVTNSGRRMFVGNGTGLAGFRVGFDVPVHLPASTTGVPVMNVPDGVAPTSPTDGDIWFEGNDMKRQIGGVTKTLTFA